MVLSIDKIVAIGLIRIVKSTMRFILNSLKIGTGILGDQIIWWERKRKLNGYAHLGLLKDVVSSILINIMKNNQCFREENPIVCSTGLPVVHNLYGSFLMRSFLVDVFGGGVPDAKPPNFFSHWHLFWGQLKSKIYTTQPDSPSSLIKQKQIKPDNLHNSGNF